MVCSECSWGEARAHYLGFLRRVGTKIKRLSRIEDQERRKENGCPG